MNDWGLDLQGLITRVVDLKPGEPVEAGRGVLYFATGTIGLKLKDGGTLRVRDLTNGVGGSLFDGIAVVDADISDSPGAVVQILYGA